MLAQPQDSVHIIVDEPPVFPSGVIGLMKYLSENITIPEELLSEKIDGKAVVQFVVEKDGTIGYAKILKSMGDVLDAEVLRVIKGMPVWTPAQFEGKPVATIFSLPVKFKNVPQQKEYDVACDTLPEFPGGSEALMAYLRNNVHYPEYAAEHGIEGKVIVKFVVERDGSITECEVGNQVHPLLAQEALRVVAAMPKWKPGTHEGKPVRVKYQTKVGFWLRAVGCFAK